MSCFGGRMKEYERLSVDRFDGKNLQSTAYFLSHLHEDHTVGLSTPGFLRRLRTSNEVFLYCSAVTKVLIAASVKYRHLVPYVKTLDINVPTTISLPDPDFDEVETVVVTFLPAFHCPGSVMCLFEGKEGTVLYTGDFRWEHFQLEQMEFLHSGKEVKKVKSVYVDTTFCTEDTLFIPTRQNCIEALCLLAQEWTQQGPDYMVYVSLRAQYGHEPLLLGMAVRLSQKVHVEERKVNVYDQVQEFKGHFTSDYKSTQLHACGMETQYGSDGAQTTCRHAHPQTKVLMILPTTMYFTQFQHISLDKIIRRVGDRFYRACYSFHSSYTEIQHLLDYLKPDRAFPNVKPPSDPALANVQHRLNKMLYLKKARRVADDAYRQLGSLKRRKSAVKRDNEALSDSESLDFGSPPKKQRRAVTPPPTPTKWGPQGDTGIFLSGRRESGEQQGSSDLQLTPCKSDVSDVQSSYAGSHHDDSEMDLTMSSQESADGVSHAVDLTGSVDMSWSGSLLDAVNANSSTEETGTQSFCVCLEDDVEQTDENYEDVSQIDGSDEEEYGLSLEQLTNEREAELPESTNQNGDTAVGNSASAESPEEQHTEQNDAPVSDSVNGDQTDTIDDACLQGNSSREEHSCEKDIHSNTIVNSTGQGHAVDDSKLCVAGHQGDGESNAQSDSVRCSAEKNKSHSDLDSKKSINDMKPDSTCSGADNGDLTSTSAEAVGASVELVDNGKGDQSDTLFGKRNKVGERSETVLDSKDRNGQPLLNADDSDHSSDVKAKNPESKDSAPCKSLNAAMTESEADDAMLLSDDAETQEPETDCSVLDTNQNASVPETEADDKLLHDEDVSKTDNSAPIKNLKGNVTESESGDKTLPNEGAETQKVHAVSSPKAEMADSEAEKILLGTSECVAPNKSEDQNTDDTATVYISSTEKSSRLETDNLSRKTSVSPKFPPVGSLDLFADTPDLASAGKEDLKETSSGREAIEGNALDNGGVLESTVSKQTQSVLLNRKTDKVKNTTAAEVTCVEDDLSNDVSEHSQDVIIIEDEMSDSEGSLFSSSSDSESFSESDYDSDIMELDMRDQASSSVHRRQVARRGGRSMAAGAAGMVPGSFDDSDSDETLPPSQGRLISNMASDAVVVVGSDSESDSGQPDCPGVEFSRLDKVAIQKTIDKLTANIVAKDQTGYSLQMLPGPVWSDSLSQILPSSGPQGQKGDTEAAQSSSTGAAEAMPGPSGIASVGAGGVIDLTCSDDEASDVN